jgi:hypothetical protein
VTVHLLLQLDEPESQFVQPYLQRNERTAAIPFAHWNSRKEAKLDFKIGIEDIGNRSHRRWLIRDSVDQYWTGKRWGQKEQALVFANLDDAIGLARKMNDRRNRHVPLRKYKVSMAVEVRSHETIDRGQLIEWMMRAVDFQFDWQGHGSGPVEDSMVWGTINWGTLQETRK